jgi:hypothetical protein
LRAAPPCADHTHDQEDEPTNASTPRSLPDDNYLNDNYADDNYPGPLMKPNDNYPLLMRCSDDHPDPT